MTNEYNSILKKFKIVIVLLFSIIILGTIGYMYLEDLNIIDAFYMTIITVSTVGFREVRELDSTGKIFTSFLILFGVSTVAYGYSVITTIVIEGELKQVWVFKRRLKMLRKLKNHYIICGYGRMGNYICKKLASENLPFVVIEKNKDLALKLETEGFIHLIDDSSREEVLKEAGIERAKALVSVVSSDADNVFIVLTARQLNPNLYIISRAAEESSELKMYKAGANKVISPYKIGGERMALAILKPSVLDFIEIATSATKNDEALLKMEEILITPNSPLCGKTIVESKIRETTGVIIVAVKKQNETMEFNPKPTYLIEPNDIFIALGSSKHLSLLEDLAYGKS